MTASPLFAGAVQSVEIKIVNFDKYTVENLTVVAVLPDSAPATGPGRTIAFLYKGGNYPGIDGTCSTDLGNNDSCSLTGSMDFKGSGLYHIFLELSFKIEGQQKSEVLELSFPVNGGNFIEEFGNSGVAAVIPNTGVINMRSAAVANDGIIVAGYTTANGSSNELHTLVKWDFTGNLVPAFGTGGISTVDTGPTVDRLESIVVDPLEKIHGFGRYVGGDYSCRYVRYTGAGALDTSFSGDGIQAHPFGGANDRCFFGSVFDDGRIFVGGYNSPYSPSGDTYFYGYLTTGDGSLDATFGVGGLMKNPMTLTGHNYGLGMFHISNDKLLGTDDQFLLIGYHNNGVDNDLVLSRINNNGSLDTSLGTAGIVRLDEGLSEIGQSVSQNSSGQIYAAGYSGTGVNSDAFIAKFSVGGTLDPAFGTNGIYRLNFAGADVLLNIHLQSDNKVLAAGYVTSGTNEKCIVVRLNSDGSPDLTFADNGIFTFDMNDLENDRCTTIMATDDQKIYVAGYGKTAGSSIISYFVLAVWL